MPVSADGRVERQKLEIIAALLSFGWVFSVQLVEKSIPVNAEKRVDFIHIYLAMWRAAVSSSFWISSQFTWKKYLSQLGEPCRLYLYVFGCVQYWPLFFREKKTSLSSVQFWRKKETGRNTNRRIWLSRELSSIRLYTFGVIIFYISQGVFFHWLK